MSESSLKVCSKCHIEKILCSFYAKKGYRDGHEGQCKTCKGVYRAAHRRQNFEREAETARKWRKANPRRALNNVLKLKFGITVDSFEKLYRNQNGNCKICEKPNLDGRRLAVDHCHATGKIRGLLCDKCNRALGLFQDSTANLQRAFDYLEGNQSILR